MHRLVILARSAKTACGIKICAYYPGDLCGNRDQRAGTEQPLVDCRVCGPITCEACKRREAKHPHGAR